MFYIACISAALLLYNDQTKLVNMYFIVSMTEVFIYLIVYVYELL